MRRLVTLTLSVALMGSAFATTQTGDRFGPVNLDAFYLNLPEPDQNAAPGTLLVAEQIASSVPGVKAWKIAYITTDVRERRFVATGLAVVPDMPAPVGGRPMVAWAHGTTGTAQSCGPSQILDPVQPLNQYFLPSGNSWTDFGFPAMEPLLERGYALVAPDYQGLGGGGRHQYAVAASQGRDTINALRALYQIKDAQASKRAAAYGWSQGGASMIGAASLPDYLNADNAAVKDIEMVGFVAMAPDDVAALLPPPGFSNAQAVKALQEVIDLMSNNVFNFTHLVMNLWGTQAAFDDRLKLSDMLTDDGAKAIDEIMLRKCVHVAGDTINYVYGENYKALIRPTPANAQAWVQSMAAGSVQPVKPLAPVAIYWGTGDVVVPPMMHLKYMESACKLGGEVTRIQLPGKVTHFGTPAASQSQYVEWLSDRFAGKPLPTANGCGSSQGS
jgi:pimeloyl-ACP methyl ester carboxylesterase